MHLSLGAVWAHEFRRGSGFGERAESNFSFLVTTEITISSFNGFNVGSMGPYTCGVVDLHLGEQLAVDAEVAELAPLVADDAVALAGHGDEAWESAVVWPLQSPKEVPSDGVE